jgi:alpha-amylase/alpha-mannosidase (GH57 family)
MIYWAQLFHFYQPALQLPAVLKKVCNESYEPLIDVFRNNPHARATVNIQGATLEMLHDYGHDEVITGMRELAEKGQIEFTGSGKYHPILPLIPDIERRRQIELNLAAIQYFLGKDYSPRGFFPPEMAYSREILPEVISMGHQWIIVSGVACPNAWPLDKIYQIDHDGHKIAVLFRDDILSNKISFKQIGPIDFFEHLQKTYKGKNDMYVITAMDAETYGHHIQNWEQLFLAAVYERLLPTVDTYAGIKQASPLAAQQSVFLESLDFTNQVKSVTVSELLNIFKLGEIVDPKASSWSTTAEDITAGNYYPLWLDKNNEIHRLQWEHLNLCLEMVEKSQECVDSDECSFFARIARGLLDIAEHSDQFWWASRQPMWDINLIHQGLIEQWRALVNGYRAINKSTTDDDTKRDYYYKLTAARDIRNKIVDRLFLL